MKNYKHPTQKAGLKIFLRVIVTVVLILPVMLLTLLSTDQIPNFYWLMLVKALIPLTAVGYLLFGISDQVCAMFELYDTPKITFDELVEEGNMQSNADLNWSENA